MAGACYSGRARLLCFVARANAVDSTCGEKPSFGSFFVFLSLTREFMN